MSVKQSKSIFIQAPVSEVLAIILDVEKQPSWFPGTVSATVLATDDDGRPTQARIVSDVKVAKDEFDVTYQHTDNGLSWSLDAPSKAQKEQKGSWSLEDKNGGTEATLTLEVDSSLPIPGFLQKKALGDTVKNGLAGLKKIAES